MATPATTPGTTGTETTGAETTGAASAAIAASAGAEAIRTWLTERVAYFLDVRPQDIAADDLLVEIGLDSVYALTLCGDVEDEFGILVEATLAWDHPTIDALTAHIHSELAAR
ncbi:acyl carrier protein [Streptomyces collinus]|uniref:Acyl carrier protein n=1 Tax=Streptomyces collinus TaxID=42684 RepID=A0AA89TYB5_STRCU|nr:acyl carrier protein [Streptomyces collinus]MBB5812803.1 acyl carrier protein [Streptomyces collinus]WMX65936.1 acyl carrier protein [Streptomyces collinus]